MKKLLTVLLLTGALSGMAYAHIEGFRNGITARVTVAEALKLQDNSYVTIRGNIVNKISDDKYNFKDSTGTITIEIDNNIWMGQSVDTYDELELTGEIEKKYNSTIFDVDTVRKVR